MKVGGSSVWPESEWILSVFGKPNRKLAGIAWTFISVKMKRVMLLHASQVCLTALHLHMLPNSQSYFILIKIIKTEKAKKTYFPKRQNHKSNPIITSLFVDFTSLLLPSIPPNPHQKANSFLYRIHPNKKHAFLNSYSKKKKKNNYY